jgi:hypothetical protein
MRGLSAKLFIFNFIQFWENFATSLDNSVGECCTCTTWYAMVAGSIPARGIMEKKREIFFMAFFYALYHSVSDSVSWNLNISFSRSLFGELMEGRCLFERKGKRKLKK